MRSVDTQTPSGILYPSISERQCPPGGDGVADSPVSTLPIIPGDCDEETADNDMTIDGIDCRPAVSARCTAQRSTPFSAIFS